MPDLSILIPARNEMFLARTIEDVLANSRANTEVIAVLDGEWPDPQVVDHDRLRVTHSKTIIGQRAATNLAAQMSRATYVMKLDAHCSVEEGFDVKLIAAAEQLGRDVTQIPQMRNLHAFNRRCLACGHEMYQGPMRGPKSKCEQCESMQGVERVMIWKPRSGTRTEFWRFDAALHFQYWHDMRGRPGTNLPIVDVMSSVGACFFMRRDRFWELGGLDEAHGSWGQFGTEIACKSWLSGGRHVVNRQTWFAHMFRTQGDDFGFPYQIRPKDQDAARVHSRQLWLENTWPGQTRPLSWLVDKFSPIPGWHDAANADATAAVMAKGRSFSAAPTVASAIDMLSGGRVIAATTGRSATAIAEELVNQFAPALIQGAPTKGLAYYSDNRGDQQQLAIVRHQIERASAGQPIVSATLGPVALGKNLVPRVCKGCGHIDWTSRRPRACTACHLSEETAGGAIFGTLERGYLTMFRQQLAALEALETDVVFMVEHDVLYHPSHFVFTPPDRNVFYYNRNTWKVNAVTGHAVFYLCDQVSGLCAFRETLVDHYRRRLAVVEREGFSRNLGFEPGTNGRARALDGRHAEHWMSPAPNVDIRHAHNLTKTRWTPGEFRNKNSCTGWQEAPAVPGWGMTSGRFAAFLEEVADGRIPT